MQRFEEASEYDRTLMYANFEKWWLKSPNYKRKRFAKFLAQITEDTTFSTRMASDEDNVVELNVIRA